LVYPKTNSLLTPKISTGLSTSILVKVGLTYVGAIQNLTINEKRDMNIMEEIGTEGVVEVYPKGAAKIDLTVERIIFDQLRMTEAFSRGFVNIQAQRIPFDIQIIDTSVSSAEDNNDAIVHTIHECWFSVYSPKFTPNSFIISENATIIASKITTMRSGNSAVFGGTRGVKFDYDVIERSTDVNGRVGKFDSAGFTSKG
jgi:tRNA A-37 threonylcarbamoyl transferase component Bud32